MVSGAFGGSNLGLRGQIAINSALGAAQQKYTKSESSPLEILFSATTGGIAGFLGGKGVQDLTQYGSILKGPSPFSNTLKIKFYNNSILKGGLRPSVFNEGVGIVKIYLTNPNSDSSSNSINMSPINQGSNYSF